MYAGTVKERAHSLYTQCQWAHNTYDASSIYLCMYKVSQKQVAKNAYVGCKGNTLHTVYIRTYVRTICRSSCCYCGDSNLAIS